MRIRHIDGRLLGTHQGIINFTIGQRRGIGVATGEPIYVVHLDADNARVIVGPKEALETRRLYLRDVNWLGEGTIDELPEEGLSLMVKVRSTRPPIEAVLFPPDASGRIAVDIVDGEAGIAAGQACVFYEDESEDTRVLGGGFIDAAMREAAIEANLGKVLQAQVGA